MAQGKSVLLAGLVAGAALAFGCTAGIKPTTPGTGGNGGSGPGVAGTTGGGGTTGAGGVGPGAGGSGGTIVINPDAGACQQVDYSFEPKIPTVYLMVDRSGSMFDCQSTTTQMEPMCGANGQGSPMDTSWYKLKEAARGVLASLEHDVRFGFATIWGQIETGGGMCPPLHNMIADKVAPAQDNATAIMTLYDSLPAQPNTTQQGMKFETPASETIQILTTELVADKTPGDKYILFITDGQPDYCDDSNSLCAPDSVVAYIQTAYAMGIKTIVMGLQTSASNSFSPGSLQAWANAGAGEPTVAPLNSSASNTDAFYDQCNSVAGWHNDLVALGKANARGTTLGTYSATAGPTKAYMPSVADQSTLVAQLSTALSGVKSCTFDLSNINGQAIKVDRTQLSKASVVIMGSTIQLDPNNANGWDMVSDTQLQLFGTACDTWRSPMTKNISFNFPCEIIGPG